MIVASSICLNNMLDVLLIKFNGFMELHKPEFIHKPNTFMQIMTQYYLIYVLTMTERAGLQPLSPGTSFRSVVTRQSSLESRQCKLCSISLAATRQLQLWNGCGHHGIRSNTTHAQMRGYEINPAKPVIL